MLMAIGKEDDRLAQSFSPLRPEPVGEDGNAEAESHGDRGRNDDDPQAGC
jgi:hypothetical protein